MPKLATFHRILAQCEAGDPQAWRAFLDNYTPIVFEFLNVYVPLPLESRVGLWRDSLADLCRNNYQRLRAFDHQAEREFLYDLRTYLEEQGASRLDPSQDAQQVPPPTLETVRALLKGLPLLHQEIVLAKMAGYSDVSLEKLFRIKPSIAQQGLERLQAYASVVLNRSEDRCLWPAAWAEVLRSAFAARTPDCPPLRRFVRLLDGQYGWYDKEPTEEHVSACFHCLERWVALREIVHWRNEARPRPRDEVRALLAELPPAAKARPHASFLRRWVR